MPGKLRRDERSLAQILEQESTSNQRPWLSVSNNDTTQDAQQGKI